MKLLPVIAAISCLTGLSLSSAQAAVVAYNEIPDGELDGSQFFTFMPGSNTVTGSTAANSPQGTTDFDFFSFKVSAGNQVTSVTYSFWNGAPNMGTDGYGLGMESASGHLGDWEIDVRNDAADKTDPTVVTDVPILGGILPLGSGTYNWNYDILWDFENDPLSTQGGTWDYTITFDVEVPVPAAAWLFGSALLGLAGVARRQKA